MGKSVIKIVPSESGDSLVSFNAGAPGPRGEPGPAGPQGDPGILVLGLADPVPPETPEDTLIVRYNNN